MPGLASRASVTTGVSAPSTRTTAQTSTRRPPASAAASCFCRHYNTTSNSPPLFLARQRSPPHYTVELQYENSPAGRPSTALVSVAAARASSSSPLKTGEAMKSGKKAKVLFSAANAASPQLVLQTTTATTSPAGAMEAKQRGSPSNVSKKTRATAMARLRTSESLRRTRTPHRRSPHGASQQQRVGAGSDNQKRTVAASTTSPISPPSLRDSRPAALLLSPQEQADKMTIVLPTLEYSE